RARACLSTLDSQYLGIALLAAFNVHALIWSRTRPGREWLAWLAANAVLALGFLPWLPTFIEQQGHPLNTSARTVEGLIVETLEAYGGGVARGGAFLPAGGLIVALPLIGGAALV